MKGHIIEGIVLLACVVGIVYFSVDWHAVTAHKLSAVQVNGKTIALQDVVALKIPQEVYDGIKDNPTYKEYLFGNKKQVLLLTWDGCPYARAYKNALTKAFKFELLKKYYTENIVVTGQSVSVSCNANHLNCPEAWIKQNCLGKVCIINPFTKEAIVDASRDANQILPLLMAQATWLQEPLIAK